MIAAKKAWKDSNELQRLQRQLAYEKSKEQYEMWLHRRMMMERAARLRKLERLHTQGHEEQERLKTEMENRLRETKKRQQDEARKAAEKVKEEIEEAAEKAREIRQRTEDARQRAAVKASVEKAILEQQELMKIKQIADDIQEKLEQEEQDKKNAIQAQRDQADQAKKENRARARENAALAS